MIHVEITIGRKSPTVDVRAVAGDVHTDAIVPVRDQRRPWQLLLASAAAALMLSFVATPNSPYAAGISASGQPTANTSTCAGGATLAMASTGRMDFQPLFAVQKRNTQPWLDTTLSLSEPAEFVTPGKATTHEKPNHAAELATPSLERAPAESFSARAAAAAEPSATAEIHATARQPDDASRNEREPVRQQEKATADKLAEDVAGDVAGDVAEGVAEDVAEDVAGDVAADVGEVPDVHRRKVHAQVSFAIERNISIGEEALINDVTALLSAGNWTQARIALHGNKWRTSVPLAKLAARAALAGSAAADAVTSLQAVAPHLDSEGNRLLAVALMQSDRAPEAAELYRGLLVATPGDAELWMGLALALDASGAAHDAVVFAYQQARDLSRDARVQRFAELRLAALA